MSDSASMVHLQLREHALHALKARAAGLGLSPDSYTEMILRYVSLEAHPGVDAHLPEGPVVDALYFSAPVAPPLREALCRLSDRRHSNLAVFAGAVLEQFFEKHERDPTDLEMLCELSLRLEQKPVLSETDLEAVIRSALTGAVGRMPAAYQVHWLENRLRPWHDRFERDGAPYVLTPDNLTQIVQRIRTADAAASGGLPV
jgi:hypothetical protein